MRLAKILTARLDPGTLLCLALALTIYLPQVFTAGFLSDDFTLMAKLRGASAFSRIEEHHYSPFVQIALKLAAEGLLSAPALAAAALIIHLCNVILALRFSRASFGSGLAGLAPAALFALAAPGAEALGWRCCIGYPASAFFVLSALLFTQSCQSKQRFVVKSGLWLALMQFAALLTWDNGALLAPLCAVQLGLNLLFTPRNSWRGQALRLTAYLAPAFLLLGLVSLLKLSLGFRAGYATFGPLKALGILITAPSLTINPLLPKTFYLSSINLALCLAGLALLIWLIRGNKPALVWLGLFFASLGPNALFSGLASRSLYLPCLFLFGTLVQALAGLRRGRAVLIPALLGLNLWLAWQTAGLWSRAASDLACLTREIEALPQSGDRLIVVNLPDHGGPPDLNMPPLMFRNGLAALSRPVETVNTYDADFVTKTRFRPDMLQPPNLTRPEIAGQFGMSRIVEVKRNPASDGCGFILSDFETGQAGASQP